MVVEIGYHTVHLFLRIWTIPLLGQTRHFFLYNRTACLTYCCIHIMWMLQSRGTTHSGGSKCHDFARMHANKQNSAHTFTLCVSQERDWRSKWAMESLSWCFEGHVKSQKVFSPHSLETDSCCVLPVLPKGTFLWRKEGSGARSSSKHPPVLRSCEGKWRGSPEDDVTAPEFAITEGNGGGKVTQGSCLCSCTAYTSSMENAFFLPEDQY